VGASGPKRAVIVIDEQGSSAIVTTICWGSTTESVHDLKAALDAIPA
jgi:hypothetical protein